jgi:hypothetical protein
VKINLVLGQQLVFPPIRGGGVENLNWMLACEYARLATRSLLIPAPCPSCPLAKRTLTASAMFASPDTRFIPTFGSTT